MISYQSNCTHNNIYVESLNAKAPHDEIYKKLINAIRYDIEICKKHKERFNGKIYVGNFNAPEREITINNKKLKKEYNKESLEKEIRQTLKSSEECFGTGDYTLENQLDNIAQREWKEQYQRIFTS